MHNTASPQTDDNAIEREIKNKGLTAPRVTPDRIDALMARVEFRFHVEETSTFCHAFLDGQFLLATGHSACVSKTNFDKELGQKIAKENVLKPARDKLWELEGYALRQRLIACEDMPIQAGPPDTPTGPVLLTLQVSQKTTEALERIIHKVEAQIDKHD